MVFWSWVQNLSLPDERSNRETSRRIGFYSVYLVSLQGLPFTLLYASKKDIIPIMSFQPKTCIEQHQLRTMKNSRVLFQVVAICHPQCAE